MRKSLTVISIISILTLIIYKPSFAWASKQDFESTNISSSSSIFYEDFSNGTVGTMPKSFENSLNNCKISIEEVDVGNGKIKNCILLDDISNGSANEYIGPKITKKIKSSASVIGIEYRFKSQKTKTPIVPMALSAKGNSKEAFSIILPSDSGVLSFNNSSLIPLIGHEAMPIDTWFTVKIIFDLEEQKIDISVKSDYLKTYKGEIGGNVGFDKKAGETVVTNLTPKEDFNSKTIDDISFSMSRWEGKTYIDYIKIDENPQRLKSLIEGSAIKPPVVANPENVPSGRYININYKNIYAFFSNKPINREDMIFVPLKELSKIMDFSFKEDSDNISINNTKIKSFKHNEVSYVSIREVSTLLGYNIDYNDKTKTVFIKEKGEALNEI